MANDSLTLTLATLKGKAAALAEAKAAQEGALRLQPGYPAALEELAKIGTARSHPPQRGAYLAVHA